MNDLLLEVLGWFAFLQRPAVLLQLGWLAALLALLVQLRRRPPLPRLALLWRLSLAQLLLAGQGLILLVLSLAGARQGLVLLALQITLGWLLLGWLERRWLARWLAPALHQALVSRLLRPIFLVVVLLAVLDALGSLQDIAAASLGVWFGSTITIGTLCNVLGVLYLLLVGSEVPAHWLSLLLRRGLSLSEGSRRAFEQILRYLLFSIGVIWAVARLGLNQNGILAIAGGLSVGLGFGVKEVFSNVISGLWLLIEGSVRPGEVLLHGGDVCEVRRLGPRAATLWRRSDNAELVVPNQDFFTTATTTYTRSDRMRRCSLQLAVRRRWPPDQIIALLQEITSGLSGVLADRPVVARLESFGLVTYTYSVSYAIADPLVSSAVSAALKLAICRRFDALGIEPPS
ncbi:MAG: mechanosensitive ion channel domain-containing protein [Synechococcaceae cyanobacterium]|nr:mechanosensitive ion channel domain-containing protein [Synechococcaceae cyanobacterium]